MDALDQEVLALLRDHGRMTIAEIGRRVGLSRTATLARIRKLEHEGHILGYHADIRGGHEHAPHVARVGIVVDTVDMRGYVRRLIRTVPELREAESVAGEFDLLVCVAAESAERLDEILDRIAGWRETVRTTTFVVLTRYL